MWRGRGRFLGRSRLCGCPTGPFGPAQCLEWRSGGDPSTDCNSRTRYHVGKGVVLNRAGASANVRFDAIRSCTRILRSLHLARNYCHLEFPPSLPVMKNATIAPSVPNKTSSKSVVPQTEIHRTVGDFPLLCPLPMFACFRAEMAIALRHKLP